MKNLDEGIYAKVNTNRGSIVLKLEYKKTPLTVMNFIGLSQGIIGNSVKKGKFYDGTIFHRVVKDFIIQGGDPTGTGRGGPGYKFPDEIDYTLTHNEEGVLSMANAGKNTNGSQFFITLNSHNTHLNGKHTVFGKVISGMDIVRKIQEKDYIKNIEIIKIGDEAKNFNVSNEEFLRLKEESEVLQMREAEEFIKRQLKTISEKFPSFKRDENGIFYEIKKDGKGKSPKKGERAVVDYEGFLLNDNKFDSSLERGEPILVEVGLGRVIPAWDLTLEKMREGEIRNIIIPPSLAYGDTEILGLIPANSFLRFTINLKEVR